MLRTEEARNRRSQARTVYKHLKGTHDKGRIAEEPGEGKLSSPVLEQRWAGRLTHRLSQIERLCQRGAWEDRMLVETVLSMLTLVCHLKKVMHQGWAYFQARLAFTMAAFNVLVQWHGFQPNASGFVPLSIAEFGL